MLATAEQQLEGHSVQWYADRYDLSVRTLWRAIAKGDLKCMRFGRAVRISPEQWREYVERGEA